MPKVPPQKRQGLYTCRMSDKMSNIQTSWHQALRTAAERLKCARHNHRLGFKLIDVRVQSVAVTVSRPDPAVIIGKAGMSFDQGSWNECLDQLQTSSWWEVTACRHQMNQDVIAVGLTSARLVVNTSSKTWPQASNLVKLTWANQQTANIEIQNDCRISLPTNLDRLSHCRCQRAFKA